MQIDDEENVTLIDFPQMVSTSHPNAEELFDRDIHGVVSFFERKLGNTSVAEEIINSCYPSFQEAITHDGVTIDKQLRASGFQVEHQNVLDRFLNDDDDDDDDDGTSSGSDHVDGCSPATEHSSCSDDDEKPDDESIENNNSDVNTITDSSDSDKESDVCSPAALEDRLSSLHLNKQNDHSVRLKEQQVAKRLADQKRQQARRQYTAKATRNSMKSKNKGKRKGEASGNRPLSAGDFGW